MHVSDKKTTYKKAAVLGNRLASAFSGPEASRQATVRVVQDTFQPGCHLKHPQHDPGIRCLGAESALGVAAPNEWGQQDRR
jgi:hypothetical protein